MAINKWGNSEAVLFCRTRRYAYIIKLHIKPEASFLCVHYEYIMPQLEIPTTLIYSVRIGTVLDHN